VFDGMILGPPPEGDSITERLAPALERAVRQEGRAPLPSAAPRSDYGRPAPDAVTVRGAPAVAGGRGGRSPSGGV